MELDSILSAQDKGETELTKKLWIKAVEADLVSNVNFNLIVYKGL